MVYILSIQHCPILRTIYTYIHIHTYVRTYCVCVCIVCIFELAWKWWDLTLIAIWLGKYINESRHSGLPSGNFTVCYRKWPCVWLIFHDFPMEKWSCWILRLWKMAWFSHRSAQNRTLRVQAGQPRQGGRSPTARPHIVILRCVLRREWMACWGLLGWWHFSGDDWDHSRTFPA